MSNGKKTSELTPITNLAGNEQFTVAKSGDNFSVDLSSVKKYVNYGPYLLEFGENRNNVQEVVINIKGMDDGVPEGTMMYLMRNLTKKKHKQKKSVPQYHTTSGWRHPRHQISGDSSNLETEYTVSDPNEFTISTSECFAQFVKFHNGSSQEDRSYARINGAPLNTNIMENGYAMNYFFSNRPIRSFGFALFRNGVRVSNILPVNITIFSDMDVLKIYAYPGGGR